MSKINPIVAQNETWLKLASREQLVSLIHAMAEDIKERDALIEVIKFVIVARNSEETDPNIVDQVREALKTYGELRSLPAESDEEQAIIEAAISELLTAATTNLKRRNG